MHHWFVYLVEANEHEQGQSLVAYALILLLVVVAAVGTHVWRQRQRPARQREGVLP